MRAIARVPDPADIHRLRGAYGTDVFRYARLLQRIAGETRHR
jgi:hypothetical protein